MPHYWRQSEPVEPSIPQKSSHLAAEKLRSRTRLRQLRRRQDCDPLPNKSCYRNSGRSESGCDTRYQLRAPIFCARLRDEPVLSDTPRRNRMLCPFSAEALSTSTAACSVHQTPPFGLFLRNTPFLVAFRNMVGLAFLLIRIFRFITTWHSSPPCF